MTISEDPPHGPDSQQEPMEDAQDASVDPLHERLNALLQKHRALDEEIAGLESFPYQDQLLLRRLKKEKLHLKDCIQRVRSMLIPDLDA